MTLRYQAVVFDLDGTLIDSYEALLVSVNSALRAFDREEMAVERLRMYVGDGIEPLLDRCFEGSVPSGAYDHFVEHYDEVCADKSRLLDEVEETLAALSQIGVSMTVCTNKGTRFSRKILDALDASRFFTAIVGPDLADARKPDPRHVLRALEPTGYPPDDALFVGDMPIDVRAARAAGLDVAAIATGSAEREALAQSGPDFMLERFSDLVALVNRRDYD